MVELNLNKGDCRNLADILEAYFFQNLRDDESIDNIDYVRSVIKGIDELKRVAK